jgi:4-amino-4-deoxy-L-arabinose transferase-like glycosyltransferase
MRFAPFALGIACFLTLFFGLDTVGYLDMREARDARVAEELRSAGEWLTPLLGHRPLYDKPLPGYLPELLTHDSVHESPLASRLLRAALATALVFLTWRLGSAHFGPRAGLAAGTVLASSLALPLAARTDAAQLLGTLAAWIALALFARAMFGAAGARSHATAFAGPGAGAEAEATALRRSWGQSLSLPAAHLSLAAACLFAGPLPALWPLGGAALYARLSGRAEHWRVLRPWLALAVIVGLALPWYGAMTERHGEAFLSRAFLFPYGANASGPWYAGVVLSISLLVAAAFPWSALLPAAFSHAAVRWLHITRAGRGGAVVDVEALAREEREERISHFFIACLVASLVPLAFYPLPPISAALPALPAVALLCGRFLDHLLEDPARLRSVFSRASLMLGITGTVAAIAFSSAGNRLTALFPGLRWVAPFALLSGWAPFLAHFFLRRTSLAAALIALPVVVGMPLAAWRLVPELEDFVSTRRAAEAMNLASPPLTALALLEEAPPTLRLYLARNAVRIDSLAMLEGLRGRDGYSYLAYRPGLEKETARRLNAPLEVLARTPALVLARTPGPEPAAAGTQSAVEAAAKAAAAPVEEAAAANAPSAPGSPR